MNRLVILAPNWLGDAVMALPAIADVRRVEKSAHLTVAARRSIAPLFALVPAIDDTVVLGHRARVSRVSTWSSIGNELASKGFDTALLLPNSIHAALVVSRAGISERWGYKTAWRGPLLTRAVDPPSGLHQVEYYQQLVHALGFPNGPVEPRLEVGDQLRARAAAVLEDAGWRAGAPLAALGVGAAYGGAKRWPPRSFGELSDALATDGVQPVLIGSPGDSAAASEVLAAARERRAVMNLTGRTDLAMLAGVLSHCRALITNDSGAMHVGAALGLPVTALFGPTDERITRPMGDGHSVLSNPVWCRPCLLRECPLDHQCMRGLPVSAVLESARRTV